MLLVIDVGNTNITTGLVSSGELRVVRRAATRADRDGRRARGAARGPARPGRVRPGRRGGHRARVGRAVDHDRHRTAGRSSGSASCWSRAQRTCPSRFGSTGRPRSAPTASSMPWPATACTAARRGRGLRDGDHGRRGRTRRRIPRRCDRAGPRARPRRARGAHRQAAADRAAAAGPGDRPRHRVGHPGRHDPRLPGAGLGVARTGPATSSRTRWASTRFASRQS